MYGWGWTPVKWQGWFVTLVAIAFVLGGAYVGDIDDAPGLVLLSAVVGIVFILIFCFWKGEKPRWQWGFPEDKDTLE